MRGGESREFDRIAAEARQIAKEVGQPLTSAHLLLALFTVPNPAELVLKSRRVDERSILARLRELPREQPTVFDALLERAREVSRGTGGSEARALHVLVAIARARGSAAHALLQQSGIVTADLAREVLSYIVGPLPRRFMPRERVEPRPPPRVAPSAVALATAPPPRKSTIVPAHPPSSPPPRTAVPTPPATNRVSVVGSSPPREARLLTLKRLAEGIDDEQQDSPYALSPEEYPYLATLGRNLSELAALGRIDPVVGREREIDEALDILGKRRSNNPVLVGDPGVGKTAIVEGLALELVKTHEREPEQTPRVIVELDVASLVAGTHLRGSLSEKLNGIKDEVRRAGGRVVVFIDEIHMLVGAGQTGEGAQDAANELKAALARGEFPCIGATTYSEFQRYFTQDPALERRFVSIRIDEPSPAQTLEILHGVVDRYAQHHGVEFAPDAVESAVSLTHRFVRDRSLPDKAVTALDHAGSRARREGLGTVTRELVARVVSLMARLPEERLLLSDAERILGLEDELRARVVGHDEVVARVATSIRRNFAGFSGQRPLASFIFLGPTGVGKTELARCLADVVFDGPDALVRVDMSEFSESHAVAKLVGSPPGYVGHGDGGLLTEAVRRRPACVVLLDEIEKAHRDSQQLVLQLLDEGHLTDGRGRRVDFTSTIVVLTSNLGASAFSAREERAVGFATVRSEPTNELREERALAMAREAFPPELWNRIEERLVFHPLARNDARRIAYMIAARSSARLDEEKQIRFELDDSAVDLLLDQGGFDPEFGARPLRQAFSRLVEAPLAEQILRGYVQPRDRLRIVSRGGRLSFEHLTIIDPTLSASRAS